MCVCVCGFASCGGEGLDTDASFIYGRGRRRRRGEVRVAALAITVVSSSFIIELVLLLCGCEEVTLVHRFTQKAFFLFADCPFPLPEFVLLEVGDVFSVFVWMSVCVCVDVLCE